MADPKVTYRFTAKDDTKEARQSVVRGFSRMQVAAVAAIGVVTAAVAGLMRALDGAQQRLAALDSQIKQARGLGIDEERLRRIQDVFTAGGAERDDARRAALRLQQELQLGIEPPPGEDAATGRRRIENFRTLGIGPTNARFLEENPDLALLAVLRAVQTGGIEQEAAATQIFGRRLGGTVQTVAPNLEEALEVAAERAFETPDELANLAEQLADQQETARRAQEEATQRADIRLGQMALARTEIETRLLREFGGESPVRGVATEAFETAVDGWQQATDLLIQSIRRF